MPNITRKDRYQTRLGALKKERSSFDDHYKLLAQFMSPRRGRFFQNERNKGNRYFWNEIINSHATWALRVAVAGIFNGIMSPSRPWFMLETDDRDLLEFGPVKNWFFAVQEEMRKLFNNSNLYNAAPMMIREQLLFGTGCMSHMDDPEDIMRFQTHTAGTYYLTQGPRLKVDTIYREFEMTVEQIVEKFSDSRESVNPDISTQVRNAYDRGDYDLYFPVVHLVEPNRAFRADSLRSKDRPFLSVYYEPTDNLDDKFLSERGFDEFPFYCPRWELTEEDVYGTDCPGMTILGDVRALQFQERRKAQAIDMMTLPPMRGPAVLKNQPPQLVSGGGTYYDAPGTESRLEPVFQTNLRLAELAEDMDRVTGRIERGMFVDLFMAITSMDGIQPRNQLELMQRNAERLLQLGPTLERQFGEFLNPLISRSFNQMVKAGLVPPPPQVLENRPLRPRYVSTLAMAQQAAQTGTLDRFVAFLAGLRQVGYVQQTDDKVDVEQLVDEYSHLIGTPPAVIVPDDIVAERKAMRAQQEQMLQQMAMAEQAGGIARDVGGLSLEEDNVASRVVDTLSGGR